MLKIDWRKKRTVWAGIEAEMCLGSTEAARADAAIESFRSRTMSAEDFEHFYLAGVDAREQERTACAE